MLGNRHNLLGNRPHKLGNRSHMLGTVMGHLCEVNLYSVLCHLRDYCMTVAIIGQFGSQGALPSIYL